MPTNHLVSPSISVIIPTYNAGPALEKLLVRLQEQTLQPYEIIVVDSSSPDGTAEVARQYGARVYTVLQNEFDHGGTRNYAAGLAGGDILVFMTQDAMPADSSMLSELTGPLHDERVACSYGRQLARADATILERMMREYNYPDTPARKDKSHLPRLGIKTFFCSNVCAAVRKDVFVEAGRFPEPVIFNEDLFLAAKCILQGYSVVYAAQAKVIHSHNYSLMQQFRRFFDNGVSMRNNDWVFQYSAVGKEGMRLIRNQLKLLHRQRQWTWMPRLVAESAVKFIGYQLGKRHRQLPNSLCVKFSMHPRIWDKISVLAGGAVSKQ